MEEIVSTSYDILNRKLSSAPKLLLLPQIIVKQTMLFAQIFPFIMGVDFINGRIVAVLLDKIERLNKERKAVSN